MPEPDLAASKLLWRFRDVTLRGVGRPRLDGVALDIVAGSTAVIGYSGAGKTSLLNVLVGFEHADLGSVETSPSGRDARMPLFWVPQAEGLWPHLSVLDHIAIVSPPGAGTTTAESLLAAFDLASLRDARPDRLSQGERSRLAVARSLASHATVLVMDEPLVHVDPARTGGYWNAIREHCRRTQTSLVFATHVPEVVLREAERVVCLDSGRVVFAGDVPTLYDRPPSADLAAYLGPINWFRPGEAWRWLDGVEAVELGVRPERMQVEPGHASPLVVESSRFAGSVAEVELRNETTGERRTIFHRPAADRFQSGDRVRLRVVNSSQREMP